MTSLIENARTPELRALTQRTLLEIEAVGLLPSPYDGTSPQIPTDDLEAMLANVADVQRFAEKIQTDDEAQGRLLASWIAGNQIVLQKLAGFCSGGDTFESVCNSTYPHAFMWTYGETLEIALHLAELCSYVE